MTKKNKWSKLSKMKKISIVAGGASVVGGTIAAIFVSVSKKKNLNIKKLSTKQYERLVQHVDNKIIRPAFSIKDNVDKLLELARELLPNDVDKVLMTSIDKNGNIKLQGSSTTIKVTITPKDETIIEQLARIKKVINGKTIKPVFSKKDDTTELLKLTKVLLSSDADKALITAVATNGTVTITGSSTTTTITIMAISETVAERLTRIETLIKSKVIRPVFSKKDDTTELLILTKALFSTDTDKALITAVATNGTVAITGSQATIKVTIVPNSETYIEQLTRVKMTIEAYSFITPDFSKKDDPTELLRLIRRMLLKDADKALVIAVDKNGNVNLAKGFTAKVIT